MAKEKRLKYAKPELLDLGSIESTAGIPNCSSSGSTASIACAQGGSAGEGCVATGASAGDCQTGGTTSVSFSGAGFFSFDLSKPTSGQEK